MPIRQPPNRGLWRRFYGQRHFGRPQHLLDLESGQFPDTELKLFILGNGGVGKTQLSRRLRNLPYDTRILTTHGIELNLLKITVDLENFQGKVSLNLWDFGGQAIYHGSHTLFLHSQAIFCILWTPEEQAATSKLQKDSAHWAKAKLPTSFRLRLMKKGKPIAS